MSQQLIKKIPRIVKRTSGNYIGRFWRVKKEGEVMRLFYNLKNVYKINNKNKVINVLGKTVYNC